VLVVVPQHNADAHDYAPVKVDRVTYIPPRRRVASGRGASLLLT
jgi:hypothetical protein